MFTKRPNAFLLFLLTLSVAFGTAQGLITHAHGKTPAYWFAYAGVAGLFSIVLGGWYVYDIILDLRDKQRDIDTRTARLRELQAAAKLTPEQAKLVPITGVGSEIDTLLEHGEFVYYLMTPEGRVPLDWVREFIRDSGVIYLRAINTWSEGTVGYDYATWLTNWFVNKGFALPHQGPHPAQWKTEQTKAEICQLFGVEWQVPSIGMGEFRSLSKDET